MSGADKCNNNINDLEILGDKMADSLDPNDKGTLDQITANLRDKYQQMIQAAEKMRDQLQSHLDCHNEFQDDVDDVIHLLKDVENRWETSLSIPPCNPDHAQTQIQEVQEFLHFMSEQQPLFDKINDLGRGLERSADASSQIGITDQLQNINERWNKVNTEVEQKLKDSQVNSKLVVQSMC